MIRPFLALVQNGFREARRNRVTVVISIFAAMMLLFSALLTNLSVATFDRVLTDVGIGTLSIVLTLLAVFLSSGLLSREIERRTIFLVVSKPVSRTQFLLARFAGNMLTLAALLAIMGSLFFVLIRIYGTHATRAQAIAIGMLFFELMMLSSIGFAVSTFSGQIVSASFTLGLYFVGHTSATLYQLGAKSKDALIRHLAKGAFYILPDLERVNYRSHATYELMPGAYEIFTAMAYAVAYSAAMLAIAAFIFNRRDFK